MRALARRIVERIRDWRARRRPDAGIDYAAIERMRREQAQPRITQQGDRSIRSRRNTRKI